MDIGEDVDEKVKSEGGPSPTGKPSQVVSQQTMREPEHNLLHIFECPVCRQLMHNPVSLKCGHSLCEYCMIQFLQNGAGRCKCPAGPKH
eukprot:805298-Amorphochlora_amoeboformis.AAC.1